jgi:ATP-dependent Clp protease protease subunit
MTGHIFIEGEIGSEVTAKTVRADIANYPHATEWTIHINSPGGDVYEGYQIGSIIKNIGKPTFAHIGSMCASIATYAALSCDEVIMNPHGDFMIHLPTGTINGTAEDLRRGAEQLDRIKSELIDRYSPRVARKGVTKEELSAMIEKETSMSPSEALAMGFIDGVQEKMKAVAKLNKLNDMENMLTKEEAQGFFKSIGDKLDKFINGKFKNVVELALADGTLVQSDAATPEEVVGSTVTLPDGTPVPDGVVETADGYVMTVAGGKVASYEPKMDDAKADPTEELKKQIAELQARLEAKTNEATQANAEKAKIEASLQSEFKNLKIELDALKSKTFGDPTLPGTDPEFKEEKEPVAEYGIPSFMNDVAGIFKTKLNNK